MAVIAVANSKGGVGKTVSSVILAEVLATYGPTVLADLDHQRSATDWHRLAGGGGMEAAITNDLPAAVANLGTPTGWDHIVIDTPPGDSDEIGAAFAAADLVIVPTTPSPLDLKRARPTMAVAMESGIPAVALLTMTTARSVDHRDALSVLDALDIPVFSASIPRLVKIVRRFGLPVGLDVCEIYKPVVVDSLGMIEEMKAIR